MSRRPNAVAHVTGIVLMIGATGMCVAALVDLAVGGREFVPLLRSAGIVAVPGAAMWRFTQAPARITNASIFSAVFISWVGLSVAGAIPYLATGTVHSFDLALFESVSGFTTTGSTILRPIESAGAGLLFWRATTQWMGGIGVVVFAVSVLPFLGVGGMELLKAEAPGPTSERLAPRVRETAKALVTLYVIFTTLITISYMIFGMGPYDAVTHSFTTISTGGFSPHDGSFAHFNNPGLEWTAVVAMVVAGGNFALYWAALKGRPGVLWRSTEAKAYALIVLAICAAAVAWNSVGQALTHTMVRKSIFTVVSIVSTTGYTDLDYDKWVGALQLLLIFAMGLGGMAGSTAGGFKVFRLLTVLGYGRRQVHRQLHPRSVRPVRLGSEVIPEALVGRVVGFFVLFMTIGGAATFAVAAFGADMRTAISAVATSIGNVGPGLGRIGPTQDFLNLHRGSRMVLMLVMLIGRLEIFPVLLGFSAITQAARASKPLRRIWPLRIWGPSITSDPPLRLRRGRQQPRS